MIWILFIVFFTLDGQHYQAAPEPTYKACADGAEQIRQAASPPLPPPFLNIVPVCVGPMRDPSIPLHDAKQ